MNWLTVQSGLLQAFKTLSANHLEIVDDNSPIADRAK